MPKKHRKGRGGNRGPQRRHLRSVPTVREAHGPEDQALFQDLRRALRSDSPLDLLAHVSTMLTVTDPRSRDPFNDDKPHVELDQLVESFSGVDYAETTAALTVIQALTPDEVLRARLAKVLATRRQPMPAWLTSLGDTSVERVAMLTHVLGDGDDYFVEGVLPAGERLTALVYVDHNLGTVVKDAFIIPDTLDVLLDRIEETNTDPDQTIEQVDPATVRAIVTEAIDHGARMYPPLESDTWPSCRPLVEWLVSRLPAGGSVPERPEWSEEQLAALREEFFASPYGRALGAPDERSLLEDFTWFGIDWGPGDPLRWSPVNVEMLLVDWIPRKIIGDTSYLAKAPAALRAWIRFCHARKGLHARHTTETLAAVDRWEPDYQRLIRSARPQGAEALLDRVFEGQAYDDLDDEEDWLLWILDEAVGGHTTLMKLDDAPLPDEPFEWAGIPDDVHERVREVLEQCDRCADELLDVEHRTAMRRFLSRAAAGDPTLFRRKSSPARGAAAIAWTVTGANRTVGYRGGPAVRDLLAWFGVSGSVSERARTLIRAAGLDEGSGNLNLGAPDLLVSRRRREIITMRDETLARRES